MNGPVDLAQLEAAIQASWSAETAHSPAKWSSQNPAAGQCWTTAYVVRHFLGGDIVLAELVPHSAPIQRHAWNRLPSGADLDLTRQQFAPSQQLRECHIPESVIAEVSLAQAQVLLQRVSALLGKGGQNDG